MERLTKKELRALLELINECYPICDLEIFAQRVFSMLSKIAPEEIISHHGVTRGGSAAKYSSASIKIALYLPRNKDPSRP